jgi:SAM-dependent methyltransferase
MPESMDIFGEANRDYHEGKKVNVKIVRDDGYVDPFNPETYFRSYPDFDLYEKRALKQVKGRVLDVGCGPGRISLYLQRKGFNVTGIDCSEATVEVARERGVEDCRLMDVTKLRFKPGSFDTILMFGNNFGIAGPKKKTKQMLRDLHKVTSKNGRIIAQTITPGGFNVHHLAYVQWNLERGRDPGLVTLVFEYKGKKGKPWDFLLVSPVEMMELCNVTGWKVKTIIHGDLEKGDYIAIAEKA